ncbi:hypothetical protein AQUCO_01300493v1 [Aquilegia coerulea]|uniref:Protein kinase domain-containing protein n=1 Tax=Aquilegia coerulea TaxID=218851 RepID=A0A2G5E262_AQUCA|nr:hypothetical protein AQUCO_01300493v1 [Aquilegia coerulea]
MGDKGGGDGIKKQQQQHSTSPKTQHDKPTDQPLQQQQQVKRPRYESTQWKLLPSQPAQQQQQQQRHSQMAIITSTESTPSPTNNPQPQLTQPTTHSSSSPTPSSPSGQETNKSAERLQSQTHSQFRKGKYVSPVWKPIEMLWLAKAWRVQYQGGGADVDTSSTNSDLLTMPSKGKTRAEKDREVAEFLNLHGVNRDAKTAGTKWDNMLGEFRKVYEWEKGNEREQVGKSYFRLSPYERKNHRLPASFDEEVYNELSQFMGFRLRTPQTRGISSSALITTATKSLPTPPSIKEDETSLSAGRVKQVVTYSGNEGFSHGISRGNLFSGFDSSAEVLIAPSSSSSTRDALRRIGRIRMTWEESISLWAEEGEYHRGRVKLEGLSFLNADEVTFLDETMVGCTMEAFEDGPLKGFSIDKFTYGQQVKVFGRRKSTSTSSGFRERIQLPFTEPSIKSIPPWEYQDPTEYYMGCLRVSPTTLPSLIELTWHLQEPPPEDSRFPLRKDVYRDLPQGKELFFTTSNELLDCRAITFDILSPIVRSNSSISSSSRDSFIGLWDDCINRVVAKFCSQEMVFIRKPSSPSEIGTLQDQWPNVTGFVRNLCLWRGEEIDQTREGNLDPSFSIAEKVLWTYMDLPYILGYYAIGYLVTFCALSRSQDRVVRTDLYTVDLSTPTGRLKALVPCWRIAGLLPLLAERLSNYNKNNNLVPYSDFEVLDLGGGNRIEFTPNVTTRIFSSKRKWTAIKEIYDFLDDRIPHVENIFEASEKELSLVFKPRGFNSKPTTCEELVEALKFVTKALVALHDVSFMHRDLGWDKVMKRCDRENEWFVTGFDEAVGAPQIYPHGEMVGSRHAPEMGRGLHGVKVDVWGVGQLLKTCGLVGVPKMLRELQNMCLDQNPELRPTAADCYHHLLQLQSSLSAASGGY